MVVVIVWIICAFICAAIAGSKNRSVIGWFFLGLLLGVLGVIIIAILGDPTRVHTVIINNSVSAGAIAPPAMPTPVDTSRWKAADREAHDRQMVNVTPRTEPARLVEPVRQAIDPKQMQPAIVALKVLAEAGPDGFDERAVDAVMTYLEVENGDAEYSRREAADLTKWMRELPSDDPTIREALADLLGAVSAIPAFMEAVRRITGREPTERQERWVSFLRKRLAG